ncbi:MAG: nucleotidyl transferase AbiEii/AbiGii toxin family protein [Acidimicrobiaceae bacterium]|nr:nucleotidyl transferase AbiEii/AbiGii toxin family protein [Acidimicrobiia bacterium]MCY4492330.1 nucleotidyl transferase AbiEii/AbiGii toxin family protein [Acidimicrobiaceae bacterium]
MTPVGRDTQGGRAYLDLQRLARSLGRPTDELLRGYVLERFLWRVASSRYRDQLILKGGMLMATLAQRRPTADVDMLAKALPNELEHVSGIVAEITRIPNSDGVEYHPEQAKVSTIRDATAYPGVRVSVPAQIDRAKAPLRVDINVGDPVTPGPVVVEYPGLLGERFDVVSYPVETVLAEKIVTMLERGELTTRERDFADVYQITANLNVDGGSLTAAIDATIAHRGAERQPIRAAVGGLADHRQSSWSAYIATTGMGGLVPEDFDTVIGAVAGFADPVVARSVKGKGWVARTRRWT